MKQGKRCVLIWLIIINTPRHKIWYKIIIRSKMLVLFYSVVLTTKSVAPISQVVVMLLLFFFYFLFTYICTLFVSGFSAQVSVYVCAVTHRWCVSRLGSGARAMGQWIGRLDGLCCRRPIVMANGFVSSRLDSKTDTRVRCVKKERSSYSYKPLLTKYKIYYTKPPLIFLYTNICIPTTLTRSVFSSLRQPYTTLAANSDTRRCTAIYKYVYVYV